MYPQLAVWRPSSGYWYVMGAGGAMQASQQWGNSSDKARPGDYDGDGKTDFCVFRALTGTWFVIKSSTGTEEYYYLGQAAIRLWRRILTATEIGCRRFPTIERHLAH
jgi:hypothetical protein